MLMITMSACSPTTVGPTSTPTPPKVNRIAFDSNGSTYIINADGTNLMQLIKRGGGPVWSPDGQFIAFGNSYVYAVNAIGREPIFIAKQDTGLPLSSIIWSPDGKQIVFATNDNSGGGALYAITVTNTSSGLTGSPATLIKGGMDASDLAWSMDSKYLAFAHRSELHESTEVGLLEVATSKFRNIYGSTNSPTWSPDGKQIALVAGSNKGAEIVLFQLADLLEKKGIIAPIKLTQNTFGDGSPKWSPDGKAIVFVSDRDGNAEIYVMDADGSHQTRLTNNPAWDAFPSWSSDGKQLAFVSNRDGNAEIYVMDADGSHLLRLTNNQVDDFNPVWQPQP